MHVQDVLVTQKISALFVIISFSLLFSGAAMADAVNADRSDATAGKSGVLETSNGIAAPPDTAPMHDPGKPPGQNFDLSKWKMTSGSGSDCSPGLRPAALAAGATAPHFFTDKTDGAMTLVTSYADCMTSNSRHPRTEFREFWQGDPSVTGASDETSGWTVKGAHVLDAWVSVTGTNTVVGQIHPISGGQNHPLLMCYYIGSGLSCSMEISLSSGGHGNEMSFFDLPQGKPFFYRISYTDKKVCVSAGVNPTAALSATKCVTPSAGFLDPQLLSYFKIGNYDQGGSHPIVKIYYLNTYHTS